MHFMRVTFMFASFKRFERVNNFLKTKRLETATVNTYFVPQGPNSVITCRIDLKLGGNVSPDLVDKMHFDS